MGSQTAVAPKGSPNAQGFNPALQQMFPMIVIIGIIYFFLFRPQQQQAKEHRRQLDNLKTGDKVVTQGGIHGTVTAIKSGIIQVKIADNVRVDVNRTAIAQILQDSSNGSTAPVIGEKSA